MVSLIFVGQCSAARQPAANSDIESRNRKGPDHQNDHQHIRHRFLSTAALLCAEIPTRRKDSRRISDLACKDGIIGGMIERPGLCSRSISGPSFSGIQRPTFCRWGVDPHQGASASAWVVWHPRMGRPGAARNLYGPFMSRRANPSRILTSQRYLIGLGPFAQRYGRAFCIPPKRGA